MKIIIFILTLFIANNCIISQITNYNRLITKDADGTLADSTGWNYLDGYKQQRLRIPEITFIRFSKDGKYIFTFSKDNIFRKWDVETGSLLNQKLFSYPNIINVFLDYDDRYLAVATKGSENYVNDSLITYMYDYLNDSLFYSFNSFVIEWSYPSDYSNTKIIFNNNSDIFFSSVDEYQDQGFGDYYGGRMDLWEKSTGKYIKNLGNGQSTYTAKFSPNDNYFAISSQSHGGSMRGGFYNWRKSIIFYDNFSKSDFLIQEDSPYLNVPEVYLFTSDSKYLIGFSRNHKIFVRDIEEKKDIVNWGMSPIDSLYQITDIKLSKNDKYLVTTSYDNSSKYKYYSAIRFWHLITGKVVDSLIFKQSTKWLIDLSPDSVSLVAGSADGKIRLIKPKILTSINEINNNSLKLYPNPATNQVFISYNLVSETSIKIEISNIMGYVEKKLIIPVQPTGNYETRIELTSLSPGVYFLHFKTNKWSQVFKLQVL